MAPRRRPGPGPIHVLDEHVANKIAAGEVIERPASVVKELVENALDAGATRIEVEFKAGGKEYIRVTDDGGGIEAKQLPLAFERHATSKIRSSDDLFDVGTLGFRGEALPSIASVALVEVRSRTADSPAGTALQVDAGRAGIPEPVGMPTGTSVVVRRLFFNTPARYKFLRSDGAERRRIVDVVSRIALAWPAVAFRLLADGRELFSAPGDGRLASAVAAIYGPASVNALVPLAFEQDGLRVEGLVSKPDFVHGNRDRMSIFLNRRWIQSTSLMHAVLQGYETLLPPRRFPLAVIHLAVDPKAVDVNVHPAKAEVRFQDDGAVYRTVMRAVRFALLEGNLVGPFGRRDPHHDRTTSGEEKDGTDGPTTSRRTVPIPFPPGDGERSGDRRWIQTDTFVRETRAGEERPASGAPSGQKRGRGSRSHGAMYDAALRQALYPDKKARGRLGAAGADEDVNDRVRLREMTVLGQLQKTFILGETAAGLWIVDQHVAHERVLYERYLQMGGAADGVQRLLVPVVVTLTPDRIGLVERFSVELTRLGFDLKPFGATSYAVRGVPVALANHRDEARLTALLEDILDACAVDGRWNDHDAAAALACKAAVKAGDPLTREQMQQLLLQLSTTGNPFACPHGRPIVVEVGRLDLERRFGRR